MTKTKNHIVAGGVFGKIALDVKCPENFLNGRDEMLDLAGFKFKKDFTAIRRTLDLKRFRRTGSCDEKDMESVLINLNDYHGFSFSQITDVIEERILKFENKS